MDYKTQAVKENLEKSGIPSDLAVLMALAALKKPVNPEFLDSLRDENTTLAEEVANWGNGVYDITDEPNHSAEEIISTVAVEQ